jgi:LmbE family N-acetylglucosaminyl deacetylase
VEGLATHFDHRIEPHANGLGRRMIHLELDRKNSETLQVLCLGAHSDDIEIGCGGTVLRLAKQYPSCVFNWVVFSANGVRAQEAQQAATLFAGSQLKDPVLKTFRDGFMPFEGAMVKDVFEELKATIAPDVIFTHSRRDAHQDHRLLAEMTWNTFRDHFILEYEIPKYDGDMGQPSVFVPLDSDVCQLKVAYLMDAFPSQRHKRWFEKDTFLSLMRLRGMESNSPSGYAEAFYCRKLAL